MAYHSRATLVALAALAAVTLTGCESIMVATGLRMRLDGVPLQAIAASMPGDGRLAPGGKATLAVVATATDGRMLASAGAAGGKVLLDSYVFEATGVSVDRNGVVRLSDDPRPTEGTTPHVRLHAAGQETPVAELDIPIHYDVAYRAVFSGSDGVDGMAGLDGTAGSDGSSGSTDPGSPSPGGNGGNGGNGDNGSDGGDGAPGPDVQVTVALAPGPHPLLHVHASAPAQEDRWFVVDPAGGSLALTVRGGHAGSGGRGGSGGAGGSGGDGSPSGSSGFAGNDGLPGHDGNAGRAGHVTMAVDPAAAPYVGLLRLENVDGAGRAGAPPVVEITPVTAPW